MRIERKTNDQASSIYSFTLTDEELAAHNAEALANKAEPYNYGFTIVARNYHKDMNKIDLRIFLD